MLGKIGIIFACIFVYKLVSNIFCFFRIKQLAVEYFSYTHGEDNKFPTYKREIINLLKRAEVKDSYIPTAAALGLGQVATYKASIFNNFLLLSDNHIYIISNMFNEAIGIFRSRIFETFSPLYWIDCIIFLPRNIFQYLGVDPEKILVKILQIIWWIVAPISVIFRENISTLIKHSLSSFH